MRSQGRQLAIVENDPLLVHVARLDDKNICLDGLAHTIADMRKIAKQAKDLVRWLKPTCRS